MAKKIINQTAFTAGEVSPILDGRVDTSEYGYALASAVNATVMPYGPIRRRNGSKFVASTKSATGAIKLLRFQFSQDVAYILEIGHQYIRFYLNGAQVLNGASPYEIATTYTSAQIPNIQTKQKGSTIYLVHPEVQPKTLTLNGDLTWTLSNLLLSPAPTYESGYHNTGVTVTPAATTGIDKIFTASAAVFLQGDVGRQIVNASAGETGRASITSVTDSTHAVCDILTAFTDTSAIASADWYMDLSPVIALEFDGLQEGSVVNVRSEFPVGTLGPRRDITAITVANPGQVTTSATHNLVTGDKIQIQDVIGMTTLNDKIFTVTYVDSTKFTLLAENTSGYTPYISGGIVRKQYAGLSCPTFRAADVGKFIVANGGVLEILSVNSSTDVDAVVVKTLNSIDVTTAWSLETPTWTATRGYPRTVGLFDQRLIFGGTATQSQTVWLSEIGVYTSFGLGPDVEDAVEIDLESNEVNQINWMAEARDLVIGTSGGEFTLSTDASSNIPKITPRTYYGSKQQQVVNVKDEIIFVQGSETKVRTFRYDFNIDSYTGEDITFLAEHIASAGITEITYAQEPYSIVYAVTHEGEILSGTYDRSKKVIGWTRFLTEGKYENVQTISVGSEDQLWVTVTRNVGTSPVRYVELFITGSGEDDIDGFSDSYLTLSLPKTVSNITLADPAVVTAASHGFSNGDKVIIKGLTNPYELTLNAAKKNMSSLNDTSYTIAAVSTHTFQLVGLDTTDFNNYQSSGEVFKKVLAVANLEHLEGKLVQVKVDGSTHAYKTVTSGSIALDSYAGEVVVGLAYKTNLVTKSHEFDVGLGSMQGQKVRWTNPLIRVEKSITPYLNGEFAASRSSLNLMGVKLPLFSGSVVYGPLGWSTSSALTISVVDPLPFMLVSVTGTIDTGII